MSSRLALQGPMKAIHMAGVSTAGNSQVGYYTLTGACTVTQLREKTSYVSAISRAFSVIKRHLKIVCCFIGLLIEIPHLMTRSKLKS